MSKLMMKLMSRVYRNEEDGSGSSGAEGAAPAADPSAVDWGDMSEGVSPGSDDDNADVPDDSSGADPAGTSPESSTPDDESGTDDPATKPDADAPAVPQEDADAPTPLTPEEEAAQAKELEDKFKEWKQAELAKLEKSYAFDEDTAARLLTEPELVLPKLAAELELNATRRALEAVQRMIPQLVPQVIGSQQHEDKAKDYFYGANPDLKKHHKEVLEAGKLFRKMNPKATPEEAAEKIGNMVRQGLGLPLPAKKEAGGGKGPAQKPHRPAGAGSTRPPAAAGKVEKSVWDDLASDDD